MSKLPKSASERASEYMEAIRGSTTGHYAKGEVLSMLNTIAQCPTTAKIDPIQTPEDDDTGIMSVEVPQLRRGDVVWFKLVGGKGRPWVVLHSDGATVVAIAMSTGEHVPGSAASQCRFWPRSYLGTTVAVLDHEEARKRATRPYTNLRHLREFETELSKLTRLRRSAARKPRNVVRMLVRAVAP